MKNLENFNQKYPLQTTKLSTGKLFTYRYYKKPKATATIILLTGGHLALLVKLDKYVSAICDYFVRRTE